jgi:hypothetical protein
MHTHHLCRNKVIYRTQLEDNICAPLKHALGYALWTKCWLSFVSPRLSVSETHASQSPPCATSRHPATSIEKIDRKHDSTVKQVVNLFKVDVE